LIRNRLKKHRIRSVLRQRIKALNKLTGEDDRSVRHLSSAIDRGTMDRALLPDISLPGACALIHWCLDTGGANGYGFPFDRPHLVFYQRLKVLHDLIDRQIIFNKGLSRLWRPLARIVEDQQLSSASTRMQDKVAVFEKLREALSIAPPEGQKGLNDDGDGDIKSIEEKVKQFRKTIPQSEDYRKMRVQIDKYWDKLFADPIMVDTAQGPVEIQPQRTNNLMERFFRDIKRCSRKRCGTISLNRTLRTILADTPLVKNLDNPQYMEIVLDGCRTLEERFAKIDARLVTEKLKQEERNQQRVSPEMKKIIQRPDLPDRLVALLAT
jgi:hypothetical protein